MLRVCLVKTQCNGSAMGAGGLIIQIIYAVIIIIIYAFSIILLAACLQGCLPYTARTPASRLPER
jgi:hypothetical protein